MDPRPAASCRRPRRGERAFAALAASADLGHPGAHLPGLDAQAAVPARRPRRPVGGHDRAHRPARRSPGGGRRAAAGGRTRRLAPRRAAAILDAVAEVGPDTPVWTFNGPRPASWWVRRREHEVLVHRADAALALGVDFLLAAERAADRSPSSSACWRRGRPSPADNRRSPTAPRCTCTPPTRPRARGGVVVRGAEGASSWEHGHGKGDVAVRGPAADLLLVMMGRRPSDSVETIGDALRVGALARPLRFLTRRARARKRVLQHSFPRTTP